MIIFSTHVYRILNESYSSLVPDKLKREVFGILRDRRSYSKYQMSVWVAIGVRKNFVVGSSDGTDELIPSPKFCFRENRVFGFFPYVSFSYYLIHNTAR